MIKFNYVEIGDHGMVIGSGSASGPSFDSLNEFKGGNLVEMEQALKEGEIAYLQGGKIHLAPSSPGPGYVFDPINKHWVLSTQALWTDIRFKRDSLMQATDWVNIRSMETGVPIPKEFLAYRQALRDITNQENPENIQWPTPP